MAMQVVYSAGTTSHSPRCSPVPPRKYKHSSPRPSPRASPKEWKPVMPGYKPPPGHALVPHRTSEVERSPIITEDDTNLKDFIPAMPKSIAITCLICNILFPGLGTFLSGTTVFCCAKVRPKGSSKMSALKSNSRIALLQFITAFIFLLGWIWSIMWGTSFLSISRECAYLEETDDSNHNSTSDDSSAVSHRRSIVNLATSSTTPTAPITDTNTMSSTSSNSNPQPEQPPIIVLQEAPVDQPNPEGSDRVETLQSATGRPLNPLNPRHNRILRYQYDQQLPSLFLNPQNLENIVIHHAPVPDFIATNSGAGADPPWKG